jgi:hypothetical protein
MKKRPSPGLRPTSPADAGEVTSADAGEVKEV